MAKLPAFQFYPADWKKDIKVQSLTFEQKGIWFEILCLMHESEERGKLVVNKSPMDEKTIARLIGCDFKTFTKAFSQILSLGVAYKDDNGVIYNKRMVDDESLMQVRREAGKKGGNPNLLNQKVLNVVQGGSFLLNQTSNQNPTPSSSASSSASAAASRTGNYDIFELFRRQLNRNEFSDTYLREQAKKFVETYRDSNIRNPASLVSSWVTNMKPDIQQKRFVN